MVNLLRRKKDESGKSLLAPAEKKRGILGRKKSASARRSDQPGKPATTSATDLWGKASASKTKPSASTPPTRTPPLTPESEGQHRAPVSNVTVGQGKIHLPKGRNSKKSSKDNADEHTEYSDLTDNRTLKRLNEQKVAYELALRRSENKKKEESQKSRGANAAVVLKEKAEGESLPPDPPERSFLTELLGMMDNACKPSEPEQIQNVSSFAPEWGVAPSMDQGDKRNREADTMTDEDAFTDLYGTRESSRKESVVSTPKSTHENFEMVLEELHEEADENEPKRRPWRNPFNRGKKGGDGGEEVEEQQEEDNLEEDDGILEEPPNTKRKSARDEKDLEDKVKEALFPELEENPVVLNQLPPRAPVSKPAQKPKPRERMEEEKKEEMDDPGLSMPASASSQKKLFKRGIFKSFRRKSAKEGSPALEPVQEESPSTHSSSEPRSKTTRAKVPPRQHPVKKNVVDDIYRDLLASDKDAKKGAPADHFEGEEVYQLDTDQEASTASGGYDAKPGRSSRSQNTNSASGADTYSGYHTAETSGSGTGRLTPLVNEADQKDHPDDQGMLGGFMAMISETVAAVQSGKPIPPEVNKMPEEPKRGIPQSKSWKDTSKEEKKDDPSVESLKLNPELRRTLSAPKNVQNNNFKRAKPVWKEVKDPKTGRTYFYHRKTRKTTWHRPKEMDMPPEEQELEPKVVKQVEEPLARQPSPNTRLRQLREGKVAPEDNIRKNTARDFEPDVWSQKKEIVKLLQAMAPPDGTSVEDLLTQYEGREEELLAYVRGMKESRPFDEPMADEDEDHQPYEAGDTVSDMGFQSGTELNSSSEARNLSMSRTRSGFTSKQSEATQQIANTKSRYKNRKYDDTTAGGTSLSSQGMDAGPVARVPSKIPVRVRSRELMVEEFSADRKSEIYNNDVRGMPAGLGGASLRHRPFTTPMYRADDTAAPIVEENENDADSSHGVNDSVSALSFNELEFAQPSGKGGMDDARRRALDDAIRREDWDMAAAISEGMKALKIKESPKPRQGQQEWKQSELDKFISENDWDAVSDYIAGLRSKTLESKSDTDEAPPALQPSPSKGKYSEMLSRSKEENATSGTQSPVLSVDSPVTALTNESYDESSRPKKEYSSRRSKNKDQSRMPYDDQSFSSEEASSSDDYTDDYYSSESSSSAPRRRNSRTGRSRRPSSRGRRSKGRGFR